VGVGVGIGVLSKYSIAFPVISGGVERN
jgi:hypothetical protein